MAGEPTLQTPPWKQGEDAALALRHRLHLGDGPVHIWDVISRVDVALALHDFGPDGGDGMYLLKAGRPLIVINTERRPSRQRFTAAHELGHHELHRHDRRNVVISDPDVFGSRGNPVEIAANAFAGTLLAPAAALGAALGGKRHRNVTPEDVVGLMSEFGLSYEATCYRLNTVGLVSRPAMQELLDAGAGVIEWLLGEAGVDEAKLFPARHRLPSEYIDQAVRLWQHRHISDERFADMLRMSPEVAATWLERRGITRPELPDYDREATERLLEELG